MRRRWFRRRCLARELLAAVATFLHLYVDVDQAREDGFDLEGWLEQAKPFLPAHVRHEIFLEWAP